MTKKSEAERLRKAKELAGNDGHEWGALEGAVQHSYFHAADVELKPKHEPTLKKKSGHQHEVPLEEKKVEEVKDDNPDSSGAGPDNNSPGSKDTSKPKKSRKSKAGKKARKGTS